MGNDRGRGSLLDLACILLSLYFFWSILWRPGTQGRVPQTLWPAIPGQKAQPDPGPAGSPLGPDNEWQRINEEERRKGTDGP